MKEKKILLISHNFSPEPIGIGKYNGEMLSWFANKGYDCTVLTTFPYYPFWKIQPPYHGYWYKKETVNAGGNAIRVYRCPLYIPSNPTGIKRVVQDFSFCFSKLFVVLKLAFRREKFDLIITIAPPFHLAFLGILLRRITGGKLLYHVQDLQIEAARELKMFSNKNVLKALFKIERHILASADYVSSISQGMIDKIKAKVKREVLYFPNWVDTVSYFPLPQRELIKVIWGFNQDDFVCLYSGAAGVKQGLEGILAAAEKLRGESQVKFVICTSGPYKEVLIEEARQKNLSNVSFLPVQDKDLFNAFLNMADLHLIMQKATAGDLVMPSKLATILAVGGASIITSPEDTSLYDIVYKHDTGYLVKPGEDDLFVKKILEIKNDQNIEIKRKNARNYAVKYLNIDNVMNDFLQQVSI